MSPGVDFQEAFLFLYSAPINLILGLLLAGGLLLSMAKALSDFLAPKKEPLPGEDND